MLAALTAFAGAKKMSKWIQEATEEMKEKGTLGSFGKATPKKIAHAKAEGGAEKKKAIFAQNMKAIANKKKFGGK
jgi:hypothetical protein